MICSSVNLDRFIRPSLRWAGLSLTVEEFQGVTSVAVSGLGLNVLRPGLSVGGLLRSILRLRFGQTRYNYLTGAKPRLYMDPQAFTPVKYCHVPWTRQILLNCR